MHNDHVNCTHITQLFLGGKVDEKLTKSRCMGYGANSKQRDDSGKIFGCILSGKRFLCILSQIIARINGIKCKFKRKYVKFPHIFWQGSRENVNWNSMTN